MTRICPNPMPWHEAYERLRNYAKGYSCAPPLPPKPLILAGWAYSNDVEKMQRWEETVRWATHNGCLELVSDIPERDFYYAEEPTSYAVGPLGGPMYRHWDYEEKARPSSEDLTQHMQTLLSRWIDIVGPELARITHPIAFTGGKARRLLVRTEGTTRPPWGGWSHLSNVESERRTFTRLREAINKAIPPHEIDHIDFVIDESAEPGAPVDAAKPRG